MTEASFLAECPEALAIYRAVQAAVARIGQAETRVSKSQVGFYRRHPFAAVWSPGKYLAGDRPPLVLSLFLKRRDASARWKEVVQPAKGRFTHHVELRSSRDVDDFVRARLKEAWDGAA